MIVFLKFLVIVFKYFEALNLIMTFNFYRHARIFYKFKTVEVCLLTYTMHFLERNM